MKPRARPWPRELGPNTPVDRARTIARACWHALTDPTLHGPTVAEAIRTMAALYGEDLWLTPQPVTADSVGARPTREQVAHQAGVSPKTVTMWGSRGILRGGVTHRLVRHPDGRYHPDEVTGFLTARDNQPMEILP